MACGQSQKQEKQNEGTTTRTGKNRTITLLVEADGML